MPFYLTGNPSGPIPFLCLVLKLDHPYLNATFWGTTCRPLQVRLDELLEAVVAGKPDEISDPLLFAKLVEVRAGKRSVPPEPKLLEPGSVALNQRRDQVQDAFG
jgi:hypothetical protein